MSEFFSSSSSSSKCEEIICKESNPYSKYQKYVSIFEQNEENPEEAYKSREESKKEKNETNNYYRSCPNDKQSLGFFTWNYLHTMAIYYPSHPTEKEKNGMKHFIEGVAMFYPCKVCAIDFQKNIKISKIFKNKYVKIFSIFDSNLLGYRE